MNHAAENPDAQANIASSPGPFDGEITRLISEASSGSPEARSRLLENVYADLRRMADLRMRSEREAHTLSATALVNETYLRLFREQTDNMTGLSGRAGFFHAAAAAMRRILVDHARARLAQKRAGDRPKSAGRIDADLLAAAENAHPSDLLALDDALSRLDEVDERAAEVVRLRFFAGQDFPVIAELLGVGLRTAKRDWEFARAFLQQTLDDGAATRSPNS